MDVKQIAAITVAASIACGCTNSESTCTAQQSIEQEKTIYRSGSFTDLSWWTNDDEDLADSEYAIFASQEYTSSDVVFVDIPNCKSTDTFRASFNGLATGNWEYRSAIRLVLEQNSVESNIHGAQLLLTQQHQPSDITQIHVEGVFTVPSTTETCRVILTGKTFAGELRLFGGATFVVERYR